MAWWAAAHSSPITVRAVPCSAAMNHSSIAQLEGNRNPLLPIRAGGVCSPRYPFARRLVCLVLCFHSLLEPLLEVLPGSSERLKDRRNERDGDLFTKRYIFFHLHMLSFLCRMPLLARRFRCVFDRADYWPFVAASMPGWGRRETLERRKGRASFAQCGELGEVEPGRTCCDYLFLLISQ